MVNGWHRESRRHSLAAKGIETGHKTAKVSSKMNAQVSRERYSELHSKFEDLMHGEDTMTSQEAREFLAMNPQVIRNGYVYVKGMGYERKTAFLITELKAMSTEKEFFARRGDMFEGSKNTLIWTGAESPWRKWEPLADYYNQYEGSKKFNTWLKHHNLMFEWQDAGTIMIYEREGGAK